MEINFKEFGLQDKEKHLIEPILERMNGKFDIQSIWKEMDYAWDKYGCDENFFDEEKYGLFYSDPIWIINGIFSEIDSESIFNRYQIANTIIDFKPKTILDFGGGMGALSRAISNLSDRTLIDIYEEYPSIVGKRFISDYPSIEFISKISKKYDLIVSTDVLEHVHDPVKLLLKMVKSLKKDGYLVIANCFRPVIKCHLPITFHWKYSFRILCKMLGLEYIGRCGLSHGHIYRKKKRAKVNKFSLKVLNSFSSLIGPLLNLLEKNLKYFLKKIT